MKTRARAEPILPGAGRYSAGKSQPSSPRLLEYYKESFRVKGLTASHGPLSKGYKPGAAHDGAAPS